jgi:hypothetical protein
MWFGLSGLRVWEGLGGLDSFLGRGEGLLCVLTKPPCTSFYPVNTQTLSHNEAPPRARQLAVERATRPLRLMYALPPSLDWSRWSSS